MVDSLNIDELFEVTVSQNDFNITIHEVLEPMNETLANAVFQAFSECSILTISDKTECMLKGIIRHELLSAVSRGELVYNYENKWIYCPPIKDNLKLFKQKFLELSESEEYALPPNIGIPFMDRCRCDTTPVEIKGKDWLEQAVQEDVWSETDTYVSIDQYPHTCDCGAPAWRGLKIECSNPQCHHYSSST